MSSFKGKLLANFTDRLRWDGLHTLRYKLTASEEEPLFTRVYVDFHRSWGQNAWYSMFKNERGI